MSVYIHFSIIKVNKVHYFHKELTNGKHLHGYCSFGVNIYFMKTYRENELVIYTDSKGNRFDTFVIFDTDTKTGLTHINHFNLKVNASPLELHPHSLTSNGVPLSDLLSFRLYSQLKEKFTQLDETKKVNTSLVVYRDTEQLLANAS